MLSSVPSRVAPCARPPLWPLLFAVVVVASATACDVQAPNGTAKASAVEGKTKSASAGVVSALEPLSSPTGASDDQQSKATGMRIFAPDGSLAFNLIPWESDWILVSPSGQITGRVKGFGTQTRVLDAAGQALAAQVREFESGGEILDDKMKLLATVRRSSAGLRVLAADGTSLLEWSATGPTKSGVPFVPPLRVDGESFPKAAAVLSLSEITFAGRVALLFFLSTPV